MINRKIVSEISRTENVIMDMISQLDVISLLPVFLTAIPTEIFRKFPAIKHLVEELYDIEKKIQDRYMASDHKRKFSEDIYEEEPLFEYHKDRVSVLVGFLNAHPDVVDCMKSLMHSKTKVTNQGSQNFGKVMRKYRVVLLNKLSTTNEEKDLFKEQKNDLGLKAKKLRTDEKNLEKRLQMERKRRRIENQSLDHGVLRLKRDLEGFVKEYEAGKAGHDAQLGMKEKTITDHYKTVRNGLRNDIKKTKQRLEEIRKDNSQLERVERNETRAKESSAKNSITQYDDFMIGSTDQICGYKDAFEFNSKKIEELGSGIEDLKGEKREWEKKKKQERKVFLSHFRKMQAVAIAKLAMMETWRKYRDKHFKQKKKVSRKGKRKKGKKGKGKKKKRKK